MLELETAGAEDPRWIQKINAIIRAHFKIDPSTLDDQEWVRLFNEYKYVKQLEQAQLKASLFEVLAETLKTIYGKR